MATIASSATDTSDHTLDPRLVASLTAGVPSGAGTVTTTAPFTGRALADIPQASPQDVTQAYATARAAQQRWAATDPKLRAQIFLQFFDLAFQRKDEVLDLLQAETGKARRHAFEEVVDASAIALFYGRRAARWLRPARQPAALPLATRGRELRHPKGAVCVITPWNYPLALAVTDVTPALLAGNAVVHKPDTQTALSSMWAAKLMRDAGLPDGLWNVVVGDPAVIGEPLLDGADYIAFTGSTAGGRRIAEHAARRLIGCSLELGGKNPMLVLDDADVDKAALGAVRACFTNAGQLCLSAERIYVAEPVFEQFSAALVKRVRAMKLGTARDFGIDMGSLTFRRQLDAVTAHVEQARQGGATVLAGGLARPDLGPLFYEPTVLAGVTDEMAVCREETFGPVVSLYPVRDDAEAVRLANDTRYGLNASIWTRNLARGRELASQLQAGTVNINEGVASAYSTYGAPMGGMKESGVGRRHGREGLLCYTEAQTVSSQHVITFDPLPGISPTLQAKLLEASSKLAKKLRIR